MTVRKWGAELLVNTNIAGTQTLPSVAALAGGGYVISWTDPDLPGGDGNGTSVKFQRFDAAGNKLGVETRANISVAGNQDHSVVVATDAGFDVIWDDSAIGDIRYRRFATDGTALDPLADQPLALGGIQSLPSAVRLGDGFALAFQDDAGSGNIRAMRVFGNTNTSITVEVANSANIEVAPAIALLPAGGYVVAWEDDTTDRIRIRGFDAASAQTFAAVNVSDLADTQVSEVTITTLANGSLLVAWRTDTPIFPDGDASIRARIVSSAGVLIGSEFTINTGVSGIHQMPALAALPNGGFVAVYRGGEIFGQVFDAFGARSGDEFLVNTSTDDGQNDPSVVALADGRFVVTWKDSSDDFDDPDDDSIRQQIFDPRDGVVNGASGSQTLFGHDNFSDEINGRGGDDALFGLGGSDSLYGGDGDDTLDGGAGDDLLFGGTDDDTYVLGSGNDAVQDDGGIDTITSTISRSLAGLPTIENLTLLGTASTAATGNGLANILTGNSAANALNGLGGGDAMSGFAGNDIYFVDSPLDVVNETGGSGIDTISSSISFSLASAQVVGAVERLVLTGTAAIGNGNGLDNVVTGNAVANVLTGAGANDILIGVGGNDVMDGGAGNDRLFGGVGNDRLTGGLNNDIFVFDTAPSTALNRDVITDFNHVADTIQLENAVFTRLPAGALNPNFFRLGAAAADANDFIVYNQANGALVYDVNGNAAGGEIMFAVLFNKPAILANDFFAI